MPNLQDIKGVTVVLFGEESGEDLAEAICDIMGKAGFKRAVDARDSKRREMLFVPEPSKEERS